MYKVDKHEISLKIGTICISMPTSDALELYNNLKLIFSKDVDNNDINLPSNFKKNADGSYDVDGGVEVTKDMVKDGKLIIKFSKVSGSFWCSHNQLTSLEGAPREVGGDFWCGYNNLTSLEGAPREIGGNFGCRFSTNKFTTEEVRKVCNVKGKIYS